jgi:hypothetical protein
MNDVGKEVVQKVNREAVERSRQQNEKDRAVVEAMLGEACAQNPPQSLPPAERPTIHYTELPEGTTDNPIAAEWKFYRREVSRLLAEGQEGRWVLIKGEKVIGLWDTREEAYAVAIERYLMQPVLVHQVLTREPVLRGPTFSRLWRS